MERDRLRYPIGTDSILSCASCRSTLFRGDSEMDETAPPLPTRASASTGYVGVSGAAPAAFLIHAASEIVLLATLRGSVGIDTLLRSVANQRRLLRLFFDNVTCSSCRRPNRAASRTASACPGRPSR